MSSMSSGNDARRYNRFSRYNRYELRGRVTLDGSGEARDFFLHLSKKMHKIQNNEEELPKFRKIFLYFQRFSFP